MATTKLGDITLAKKSGTDLELYTEGSYCSTDVSFSLAVQEGVTSSDSASADVNVSSTSHSVNATNISNIIGTKTTTPPVSGCYLRLEASGSGNSKVTSGGWVDAGSLPTASANATKYFPVTEATASVGGTNTVTPSASLNGSNVTLGNTDNGISVTSVGGGTASASVSATGATDGFAKSGSTLGSGTINATSSTTSTSSFISGVTLTAPSSGTRSFSVTVPNGSSTQTVTFTVDSSGNVTID